MERKRIEIKAQGYSLKAAVSGGIVLQISKASSEIDLEVKLFT